MKTNRRAEREPIDETAAEASAARANMYGKWAHRCVAAWQSWVFWIAMRISFILSSAIDPLLFIIQKYGSRLQEGTNEF